ncbi:outer membrane protein assembly factor BamB family protein [Novipirellula artificiosorum]|nr:PQQ-binding-like beta-propeller repeat protein [Novipirellula artificiosorum]
MGVLAAGLLLCCPLAAANPIEEAARIVEESEVTAGFFVHLGAGDGKLTSALGAGETVQIHGLVRDASQLASTRASVFAAGQYGNIAFDHFDATELPYVDNLVNLFVSEDLGDVSIEEVTRVLTPNGVAMIKNDDRWTRLVKPRPDSIDEWSHYLHDASGNSVAHDDVVAPPRHLQWVGSPRWSRHHDRMASMSALVSTGGRMFYIMDEGSRISIQLPPKWKLIARDAFNGSVLWKRDIENWQAHLWPLKSGPTQLSRRLVSNGDTVYVTLGFNEPLTALDAKSGKTIRTYAGTDATEEIINTNGMLFLVVRKGKAELADYAPLHGTVGDQARSRDFFWDEEPRVLMAFDAESGRQLWAKQTRISPLSLSADSSRVFFHDGESLVSVDQKTGELGWQSQPVSRRESFTFNFGPRLVVYEDVVLYSGGNGKMLSLDSKTGKRLWDADFPNSGYQSPQDLMVVDGLVWLAPLTSGKDTGVYTGRDPRTGEVVKEFAPDVDTYWFHHRCYIAKATDNFLMPSRTGIEFVDPDTEHWDIHHWVRGGCLYGVMPCNGLTYAPPHNCACYPEAKLYGFNALAPLAPSRPVPGKVSERGRFEKGPAFGLGLADPNQDRREDWPEYRHDAGRSGTTGGPIAEELKAKWECKLGGRLTSPVIANGKVYVAQTDAHTLHALDETNGESRWTFTAGGRIDSPPTVSRGRVVFGAADGWVYCLSTGGELVWRYRAAPLDRRTMAYEQLESLWPVHGSVLIHKGTVYCVAGRSIFLDGGLRMLRLDLATGKKLSETLMDETNPDTGNNIQEKLQILQMPVGLPDILSCDGNHIFMKSQKFDLEGNRLEIGPNSGDFAKQASKQRGVDAHIFAPMGFLDDTWFHRSYWVLGQSFAGGHGGYYQAGRFAPSGRILVNGNGYVYGYGRKPQYLRWTTTLEHQLFAAEPDPPEIPDQPKKQASGPVIPSASFPITQSLNPANKPITVEAWMTTTKPNGVLIARGGPAAGFALTIEGGQPVFHLRSENVLNSVKGKSRVVGGWHHLVGVLGKDKSMKLYVDGRLAGEGRANELIQTDPKQGLDIGQDSGSSVGDYKGVSPFTGVIDEVRLYFDEASEEQITRRFNEGNEISPDAVLAISFDDGTARDYSIHRNNGTLEAGKLVDGQFGKAIMLVAPKNAGNAAGQSSSPSLVDPKWTQDVPIYVRGMVLAGNNLFIVGPPDMIDEEATFQGLTEHDAETKKLLDQQDAALEGSEGASLLAVNIDTGELKQEVKIDSLPTWDGLAGANGQLYLSTLDGSVICFGE